MSSLSKSAMDQLAQDIFVNPDGGLKNTVEYEVTMSDLRDDSTISTMRFQFKTPVDANELVTTTTNLFSKLTQNLRADAAALMGSRLMAKYGFSEKDFKKQPDIRGKVDVNFGEPEDVTPGIGVAPRGAKGRFMRQADLRNMLELVMKENLLREMTSGRAGGGRNTPLRNRTGRFVNSVQVDSANIYNKGDGVQQMSIYYRYMVYPYQVFDPRNTKSPNMGLHSAARNPQRLIGNALARAARTLLGSNYKLDIRQTN